MGTGLCTDAACTYRHTHKLSDPVHVEQGAGASVDGGRCDGAPGPSAAPTARAGRPAGAFPVALSCPCPPAIAPVLPATGSRSAEDAKAYTSGEAKGGERAQPGGRALPPLGVCWIFWKEGHCEKGDGCKFSHQLPPVQTAVAEACTPPRHDHQSNICVPQQQARSEGAESKRCSKRQRGTNATLAPSPLVHHHVDATCTRQTHGAAASNCGLARAAARVDQDMDVEVEGKEDVDAHVEHQDMHPAPSPRPVQPRRDALSSLLALTGFCSTDVVPHAHRAWLVELLDDVKLVTGYGPQQVLAVTRSIIRHLLQSVRAQQLAQAQDAGDGGEREEEGELGCMRGSVWLRGCISILHPVKITSLAALEERETFVRTQLAGSVRQALQRQRSPGDQTQRHHEHSDEYFEPLQGLGMHQGSSAGGEERARPGAGTCPVGTCYQFFNSGSCHFGGKCKYRHGKDIRGEDIRALRLRPATPNQMPLKHPARASPGEHASPPHSGSTPARIELVMGQLSSEPGEACGMADCNRASARVNEPAASCQHSPDNAAAVPASSGACSRAQGGPGCTGGQAPWRGRRHAQGQGEEGLVGMVYLRDATASLPMHFGGSLSGLELVDALVLCSSFNLVNVAPKRTVLGGGGGGGASSDARRHQARGVQDPTLNAGQERAHVAGGPKQSLRACEGQYNWRRWT